MLRKCVVVCDPELERWMLVRLLKLYRFISYRHMMHPPTVIHEDIYAERVQEGRVDPASALLPHRSDTLQLILTQHTLVVGGLSGAVVPSAAYACFSAVTLAPSFTDAYVSELVTRALTAQTLY